MADLIHVKTSGVAMQVLGPDDTGRYTLRLSASGESCEIDLGVPRGMVETALLMAASVKFHADAIAALPAQGVRVRALEWCGPSGDPEPWENYGWEQYAKSVAGTYRVLNRNGIWRAVVHRVESADFIAETESLDAAKAAAQADYERRILAALEPAEAGGVEEPISDARLECEALCARFVAGEASEKEVVDTIKKIARANERLAVLLGEAKAAARYSVSAEWAENMLPADEGVTPAAGASDDEAAMHIETALAMARVQDGYASKATGEGEKLIFKANAKAQRHIADYIRRMSVPTPAEAGGVEGRPNAPCHIVEYTNWRGETARRVIIPIRMWWGKTEWHPQEQWMLTAWDVEKEATRDFAWQDMKPVQNGATSAAVAAQRAAPSPDAGEAMEQAIEALDYSANEIDNLENVLSDYRGNGYTARYAAKRLRAALAPAEAGGVEARDVLARLSSYFGAGMGDETTSEEDFEKRIRWGIDYQIDAAVRRCADVIEELSKQAYSGQSVPWGQIKSAVRAVSTHTPAPDAVDALVKAAEWLLSEYDAPNDIDDAIAKLRAALAAYRGEKT